MDHETNSGPEPAPRARPSPPPGPQPRPELRGDPLPPELRAWLEAQTTDEEILAGLREVEEKGGVEFQDFVRELEEAARRRDPPGPSPAPYRVIYSERVRSELKRLLERAAACAAGDQVLHAAREINARLQVYP